MHVIGTAGHVDHGKSALVQALTGMDPDRLREEKERALTIDLGFAWLTLGEGNAAAEVGIVDVPGHRDFIENMLAGVGGIDLALFVVAADEGVMPQTQEHLAILDLLDVPGGIVTLTKVDLIDDPEWLELVTLDLSDTLAGTVLADAPIINVSAHTGQGVDELKSLLQQTLQDAEPRPDNGRPRLPVDRVFSLTGFGTIVTGTLVDGRFHVGDTVAIQPEGRTARIRGLQTHKTKREVAQPGSRVAINLTGVDTDDIRRGDVVAKPGVLRPTVLLDVVYRHLPDADKSLKHNVDVKLFVGAAELMARTRIIGSKKIGPGEEGWLQLALSQPVAVARGDRFILRRPSPPATLGGGRILDPHPGRHHRRFRPEVVERLQTLAQGTPAEILLQTLGRMQPATAPALVQRAGLNPETAESALRSLHNANKIVQLDDHLLTRSRLDQLLASAQRIVSEYHDQFPLRLGMPREELRSRLGVETAVFPSLITRATADDLLVATETLVHMPGHEVAFDSQQQQAIETLMERFAAAGVNSPTVKDSIAIVGEDVFNALVELGRLRRLSEDVVYETGQYEQVKAQIIDYLRQHGTINAGNTRDLLDTSRKYAIALLEHLDDMHVTRRIGDERELVDK